MPVDWNQFKFGGGGGTTTTPGTATPATPAAPKKPPSLWEQIKSAWSGDTSQVSPHASFLQRVQSNLFDLAATVPRIPAGLLREGTEVLGMFGGPVGPVAEKNIQKVAGALAGWAGGSQPTLGGTVTNAAQGNLLGALKPIIGSAAAASAKAPVAGHELADVGKAFRQSPGAGAAAALRLPGVRMIPGTNTASDLVSGHPHDLWENPVFTLLDVSPIAQEGIGKLTKGGRLAAEAEQEARLTGKLAKAQRISEEGLDVRGAAKQLLKRGETKFTERFPELAPATPSRMLAKIGFGQSARETAALIDKWDRVSARQLQQYGDEIFKTARDSGIAPSRQLELMQDMELGRIRNWDALPQNEREWLTYYTTKQAEWTSLGQQQGAYIWHDGELYTLDHPVAKALDVQARTDERLAAAQLDLQRIEQYAQRYAQTQREVRTVSEPSREPYLAQQPPRPVQRKAGPSPQQVKDRLTRARARYAEAQANVVKADRQLERMVAHHPPDKYMPIMQDRVNRIVANLAREKNPGMLEADWEAIDRRIMAGIYENIPNWPDVADELGKIRRGQALMWKALKDAGIPVQWIHHVDPRTAERVLNFPRIVPTGEVKISQFVKRGWDPAPLHPDMSIGLYHQGVEFVLAENTTKALDELRATGKIKTRSEITPHLQRAADRIYDRQLAEYTKQIEKGRQPIPPDLNRIYTELVQGEMVKFDPAEMFGGRFLRASSKLPAGEELWIPKSTSNVLEAMRAAPREWLRAPKAVVTGANRLWRFSAFTISPMYYLHAASGTAIMLLARTDPTVLRFAKQAIDMVRDGEMPAELSHGGTMFETAIGAYHYAGGSTMGRMLHAIKGAPERAMTFMHDVAEGMAYLYGKSKAEKRNWEPAAANDAGLELARKVTAQWGQMLPAERSIMRLVFPTYGFFSFLMRYTLSYPFDHPIRVAILTSITRAEQQDWDTGLPQQLKGIFFIGQPDASGKQIGVDIRGLDPFLPAANAATLAGFLSRLGPVPKAIERYLGVDPISMNVDLYPTKTLDPRTNLLVAQRPPALRSAAEALVPEVESLEAILGATEDLRQLRASDKGAFLRVIANGLGLRMLPTQYDLPKYRARLPKAQKQLAQQARSQAKRAAKAGAGSSSSGGGGGGLDLSNFKFGG